MTTPQNKANLPLRIALMILLALSVPTVVALSIQGGGVFARLLVLTGLREEPKVVTSYFFSGETYAMAGNRLAVASSVGAQLIDESGTVLSSESFDMNNPAVSASAAVSVFYDVGGRAMSVFSSEGESMVCESENVIHFADASENGYVTLITDSPNHRGRVQVFTSSLFPVFTLDCSTSGYPLSARVSPNDRLVINCINSLGSSLRFYSLSSANELACFEVGEKLILDFDFLEDGTLAVLTKESLLFLNDKGEVLSTVALNNSVFSEYCLTGRCAVLLLHNDFTGSKGLLCSYSSSGELRGAQTVSGPVYSLSSLGGQILVLYPTELTLYDESFGDNVSYQHVANTFLCLMPSKDKALLLGKSGAELVYFCE